MPLNHTLNKSGDSITVALSGDFTFSENAAFRAVVDAVSQAGATSISVDLSGVQTVDSAALSMLMVLRDRVSKSGGEVTLLRPPPQVSRVLEVVDFGKIFTIVA